MRNFLALVKVNLKNTFNLTDGKEKKSAISKFLPIIILVALLPTISGIYFLAKELLDVLIPLQQTGLLVGLLLMGISVTVFFFAIFLVPSIYYFSKDVETLLALPLQPWVIVASKFVVTVIYEYFTILFFAVPVLVAYIEKVQPTFGFYPILLIVILLLPVVPLILSSILIMLVMWLIPFAKNRDFFNYLSTFFALALAIGINVMAGSASTISQDVLLNLLMQGNNSLTRLFTYVIPNIRFGVEAMVQIDYGQLLIYVGMVAAAILLFIFIAQIVYFRGAIGINETSASRKRLKSSAYAKSTLSGNVLATYTFKELKLLIRTPIYFMNCVSTVVLLPVILSVSMIPAMQSTGELEEILAQIPWNRPELGIYVIGIGACIGWGMTSLNLITPTSISREGTNAYFMKYIPVPYFTQLTAKVLSGLSISLLGILLILIPAAFFIRLPWNLTLMALVSAILASIFMNYLGMIVDVIRPKLVWEQEASAVKQNLNAFFTMVPAFALSVGLMFIIINIPYASWLPMVLFLVLMVFDIGIVYLTKKIGDKLLPSHKS